MGRGVMTASDAVHVVYFEYGMVEEEHDSFSWLIADLQKIIKSKYPSFVNCDSWDGREEHRILENEYARIVVCEYMGCVSVSLAVLDDGYYSWPYFGGIARHWCERITNNFHKLMDKNYNTLLKLGTMNNGVSVFKKVGRK